MANTTLLLSSKVVMARWGWAHYHLPLESKVQALPACTPERRRLHMSFRLAQQRAAMVGAKLMMATLGRPETARTLVFNKDLLLVPKGDGCITGVFAPVGAHATKRGPALRMKRGAMLRARSGRRTLLPRCSNTFQTACPPCTHTCSCRQSWRITGSHCSLYLKHARGASQWAR